MAYLFLVRRMNRYVKIGLLGGLILAAFLGFLLFTLNPGAPPGSEVPSRLARISVVTSILLIALILYCLSRALRSGVVILVSRFGRNREFTRAKEPFEYWFWFTFYLLLIPLILWLMKGRLEELQRKTLPPYVQDSEERYYGPDGQH